MSKIGYYLTNLAPSPEFKSSKAHRRGLFLHGKTLHPNVNCVYESIKKSPGATSDDIVRGTTLKATDCNYWIPILREAGCITIGEPKAMTLADVEMGKKKVVAAPETVAVAAVAPAAVEAPAPKKKAAPKKKVATVVAATEVPVVPITVKKKEIGGTTYYLGPDDKVFDMKFKYVGRYDAEADEVNRDILDSD